VFLYDIVLLQKTKRRKNMTKIVFVNLKAKNVMKARILECTFNE